VETSQILNVLKISRDGCGTQKIGWINHPAVLMWRGYEKALKVYYNVFWEVSVDKWKIKVNKLQRIDFGENNFSYEIPPWLGYEPLHSSHRGRLLSKNFEYYSQFGWKEEPIHESDGYVWPISKDGKLDINIVEWLKLQGIYHYV
jgi:hypothetical protein